MNQVVGTAAVVTAICVVLDVARLLGIFGRVRAVAIVMIAGGGGIVI